MDILQKRSDTNDHARATSETRCTARNRPARCKAMRSSPPNLAAACRPRPHVENDFVGRALAKPILLPIRRHIWKANFLGHVQGRLQSAFLVARGASATLLAGKRHEHLVPAIALLILIIINLAVFISYSVWLLFDFI